MSRIPTRTEPIERARPDVDTPIGLLTHEPPADRADPSPRDSRITTTVPEIPDARREGRPDSDPDASGATRARDSSPGPSRARRRRSRSAASAGAGSTPVTSRDPEDAGTEATPDLADLARTINDSHRRGEATALAAMEHFRRAGQLLIEVKDRVGHGNFQKWIATHCEFCYRSAANYMEVCCRWGEVEALMRARV